VAVSQEILENTGCHEYHLEVGEGTRSEEEGNRDKEKQGSCEDTGDSERMVADEEIS